MPSKISIIIPVYNAERYVAKCIESILNQTFKDFQCIIIDDGSSDDSISIIKNIIGKDKRFQFFSQTNKGQGMARNVGLEHAKGEYVCFVDSDDYINPQYLQKTYDCCEKYKVDICSFNFQDIDGTFNRIRRAKGPMNENIENNYKVIQDLFVGKNHFASPCMALFKRALFQGVRFPPGAFEDTQTIILMLLKNQGIAIRMINDVLYFYVTNKGSTTRSMNLQRIDDLLMLLNNIHKMLQLYDIWKWVKKDFLVYNLRTIITSVIAAFQYSAHYKVEIRYLVKHLNRPFFNHKILFTLFFKDRILDKGHWLYCHLLLLKQLHLLRLLWRLGVWKKNIIKKKVDKIQ